jgi:hypothetical protein
VALRTALARGTQLILALLILAAVGALAVKAAKQHRVGSLRFDATAGSFHPRFSSGRRLVTNEIAYFDPSGGAPMDKNWVVTSGSLFDDAGTGWTGPIDGEKPDRASHRHTDSAVFRLVTRRHDFRDVTVQFDLYVAGLTATTRTPRQNYDGVHVWLRYQSAYQLYAVSVFRRDGKVVIKKKLPGGPANGGTYATLAVNRHAMPARQWNAVTVSAVDTAGGVLLSLRINGKPLLQTTDRGTLNRPIAGGGRVGIRGDNTDFRFRAFSATPR